jgi:hypothetical protein
MTFPRFEHDPEKWTPVFQKDHASLKSQPAKKNVV